MDRTPASKGSPAVLRIELGGEFLLAMLDQHGVEGWNRWLNAMLPYMPTCWGEGEAEPPVHYSFNAEEVDLSKRVLDGLDLKTVWLANANLSGCSLVGAILGCCPSASFTAADLRYADLLGSDITACDFSGGQFENIQLDGATYDPERPPVGLPADLLTLCRPVPDEHPSGGSRVSHPVAILASLAASSTST